MIHPTAIIDPKAELASDVTVGPYALIEGHVVIGSGTEIDSKTVITGFVRMGADNRVGCGAVIGSFPQDLSFDPSVSSGVEIGDNNVIREYCTIHRGTKEGSNTVVGSNSLFMAGAHLGHNARIADHVTLADNVLLAGYAEIHDRVFIGEGIVVHQFTRMGALSLLQENSGIGKDIPPFSIAIGKNNIAALNLIGLRRAGFNSILCDDIKSDSICYTRSGLNTKQALGEAEKRNWLPETMKFWDFVSTTKRGICPMERGKRSKPKNSD
jgi:UDP-N-acetylglucosamine acyltransferase